MWRLTFLYLFVCVTGVPFDPIDYVFSMRISQLHNGLSYNFHYVDSDISMESCSRYGSPDSYNNYQKAKEACVAQVLEAYRQELRNARTNGEINFDKGKTLCRNKLQLNNCLANVTRTIVACVEPDRRARADTLIKAGVEVLDYVCHNERERITKFVQERGQECINKKEEGIEQCLRLYAHVPTKDTRVNQSQVTVRLSEEVECREVLELQKCVVGHLKQCPNSVTANLFDGIFNSMFNVTPCLKYKNN